MRKLKKGFTIVELVIVIGVIAILSAILIPTFVSLSGKANDARAKQEVADAYTVYLLDAADGYKGDADDPAVVADEGNKLATYDQEHVWVVRGDEKFEYVSGEWKTGTYTVVPGNLLGEYNGCSVYHK